MNYEERKEYMKTCAPNEDRYPHFKPTSKKLKIRMAIPHELDQVADLILDNFVDEIHEGNDILEGRESTSKKKFIKQFLMKWKNKVPFAIFVAELDGELIGAAAGTISQHHWGTSVWGKEDFWYVKKEHRGGKVGILLFDKLIGWFKTAKVSRISMSHYSWNPGIEKFYTNRGFVPYETAYVYKVKES